MHTIVESGIPGRGGCFVPNDVTLGGPSGAPPFVVLSGPNMGGKSTMLRQCCLATLMAQVTPECGGGRPYFTLWSHLRGPSAPSEQMLLLPFHILSPHPLCLHAQVGAWVPATSLKLHPADAIFVRMGARDNIMAGQSTFYVELAETAAMLHKATSRCANWLCGMGTTKMHFCMERGAAPLYVRGKPSRPSVRAGLP